MSDPRLSVVVCTYNRREALRECLDGLADQRLDPTAWEIVVVDNGSRDGTGRFLAEEQTRFGDRLRVLEMQTPSANAARNLGIREARGAVVAFLDDDAIADPEWAGEILRAFDENPDAAAVGGPIRLRFNSSPPSWLTPEHRHLLCEFDLGRRPRHVGGRGAHLINANFAVRRVALTEESGFHPGLDRFGDHMLSGGEVELQWRLLARGGALLYWPSAGVEHCIRSERLDDDYFRRRFYWQGATEARLARLRGKSLPFLGLALGRMALLAKTRLAILAMTFRRRPERARLFRHFHRYFVGFFREAILPHRFEPPSTRDDGATTST